MGLDEVYRTAIPCVAEDTAHKIQGIGNCEDWKPSIDSAEIKPVNEPSLHQEHDQTEESYRLGSSLDCLLGASCRHDGGTRESALLLDCTQAKRSKP